MDEKELLQTVPLFSELSEEALTSLSRVAARRRYPKDTVVFFENEEGDTLFMILEGRIKVTILGDDGREIILTMLGPGDLFGEMALLDNEPRSATAIAVEETELLSLHRIDFQTVIVENPEVSAALIKVLSARLRRANDRSSKSQPAPGQPWPCCSNSTNSPAHPPTSACALSRPKTSSISHGARS